MLIGVLVGQGHFGGDGRQPQVTLRVHVRHESLVRWLQERLPRARLYGPYHHGGRSYYQWTIRGQALVEDLLPELAETLTPEVDEHVAGRRDAMCLQYAEYIRAARRRAALAREEGDDDG